MVKAEANAPEFLPQALMRGDVHSILGPEIRDVALAGKEIVVDSSAAVARRGGSMTRTAVPLARFKFSPWLRITVIDRACKRACSNPIWR